MKSTTKDTTQALHPPRFPSFAYVRGIHDFGLHISLDGVRLATRYVRNVGREAQHGANGDGQFEADVVQGEKERMLQTPGTRVEAQ